MTPREIVFLTIEYGGPLRVARSFGESDFCAARASVSAHAAPYVAVGPGRWQRTDEWGNIWGRADPTSKWQVIKGILKDLLALDSYKFPDYSHPKDYVSVLQRRTKHPDQWLLGRVPGFAFNIAAKLRGLEQYLIDLVSEKDRISRLHDRIDSMLEDMIRNYAVAGVDSIMFPEDWGSQSRTFISPRMWREEFFPRFETLCGVAHQVGI